MRMCQCFANKWHIRSQGPIFSLCTNFQLDWTMFDILSSQLMRVNFRKSCFSITYSFPSLVVKKFHHLWFSITCGQEIPSFVVFPSLVVFHHLWSRNFITCGFPSLVVKKFHHLWFFHHLWSRNSITCGFSIICGRNKRGDEDDEPGKFRLFICVWYWFFVDITY